MKQVRRAEGWCWLGACLVGAARRLRRVRPFLRPSLLAALAALAALLLPAGSGSSSQLRVPVRYYHTRLPDNEPVLLELALPAGECQVAPASLGYFAEDASGGVRRFVYTAEVPRGLIYLYQPGAAPQPGRAADPGTVYIVEVSAPEGEVYFDEQLEIIRQNVVELNRQRNLLLQARQQQSVSRSPYAKTLDALWPALYVTPLGLRDGGWRQRALKKHPGEVASLIEQLDRDAQALGAQKALYYTGQESRLKLLLSQFDLQRGLAKLPRRRSEELLSLGNAQLVQATVLAEIDRLQAAWELRRQELEHDCELAQSLLERMDAPLTGAMQPGIGTGATEFLSAMTGLPQAEVPAQQQLEWAALAAWLDIQQHELAGIRAALPALDKARQHVNARSAPDWASLPRLSVGADQLCPPQLEELRYYGALDSGLDTSASLDLLAGLARQFETQADTAAELREVFGASNKQRQTLEALSKGQLDASPDEIAYGLLIVEHSRVFAAPDMAQAAAGESAPAAPANDDPALASRAALAGELDVILRAPDSRGLAAYDLAYLKFLRWYCALGLPAAPEGQELRTQSYGFSPAAQAP